MLDSVPEQFKHYDLRKLKELSLNAKLEMFYTLDKYPDTTWFYHNVVGVGTEKNFTDSEWIKFYKHLCKYDLYYFCKYILKKTKLQETPNRSMAEKIMTRYQPEEQEWKLLCEPRGIYKTTVASIGYPIWKIVHNPNISIQIDSETDGQSKGIYMTIKEEFECNELLRKMYGDHVSSRWNEHTLYSKQRTEYRRDPTLFHTGVESSINGVHPDITIMDDLHSEQNVQTVEARDKVEAHYRLVTPLVDKQGEIIVIMTRWHMDDLAGRILKNEADTFSMISVKSCYTEDGGLYAPKILSHSYLDKTRKKMGMYWFSANYMNDPKPDTDKNFKVEWLRWYEDYPQTVDPMSGDMIKMPLSIYISCDASWADKTSNTGKDPTAIITAGFTDNGDCYVLDIFNKRISPTEVVEKIFELNERYRPEEICVEDIGTQKGINLLLEQEMRTRNKSFILKRIKHQANSKNSRIASLTPYFENGKVWFPTEFATKEAFLEQYTSFSPAASITHDDILDALEMLINTYREVFVTPDGSDEEFIEEHFDVYDQKTGRMGSREIETYNFENRAVRTNRML
jgi:predicted phage terminase large subunit-like protein